MAVLISVITVEQTIHQAEFYLLFVATVWEAVIFLYTALKNPGIISSRNSNEIDGDEDQRNPPPIPL